MPDNRNKSSEFPHRVVWRMEPEHIWGQLVCEAVAGADCRMTCDEGCESWPCGHELVDYGACLAQEWIENGDGMLDCYVGQDHAVIDAPVVVRFNGDFYEWEYADTIEVPGE